MPKGLVFTSENTITYGFVSSAKIYTSELETVTGIKSADIPSTESGVRLPWRLQDLLQAGVLKRVVAVLDDGAGKRTNRTLYINKAKIATFRNKFADGGLVGATIDSKMVLSVSIPRKASFRLP